MPTNELFIVEYTDGEIDDGEGHGSFTVYLDRASAQEMLDCVEDEDAKVVRFVREDISVVQAERLRELEAWILNAHGQAFEGKNYVYTDAQSALDLIVADLKATRKELAELAKEIGYLKPTNAASPEFRLMLTNQRIDALEVKAKAAKEIGAAEELERLANWARTEAQQDEIASGDWRDGLARLCLNRAAAIRAAISKEPNPKAYMGWMAPTEDPGKE